MCVCGMSADGGVRQFKKRGKKRKGVKEGLKTETTQDTAPDNVTFGNRWTPHQQQQHNRRENFVNLRKASSMGGAQQ